MCVRSCVVWHTCRQCDAAIMSKPFIHSDTAVNNQNNWKRERVDEMTLFFFSSQSFGLFVYTKKKLHQNIYSQSQMVRLLFICHHMCVLYTNQNLTCKSNIMLMCFQYSLHHFGKWSFRFREKKRKTQKKLSLILECQTTRLLTEEGPQVGVPPFDMIYSYSIKMMHCSTVRWQHIYVVLLFCLAMPSLLTFRSLLLNKI